ncbi:GH3 auxin-responsive promoter family protein [Leptolyngbya ohadii]|uniref:GH3 auxin-responsive promoter family protein n=1 Tax=Leptolyngbya ohadii TaxID=1962290 RepID=UPI000B59E59D|nr:GH3 auxin-responsive promoter family protein [Leptolyngbya ohadii]
MSNLVLSLVSTVTKQVKANFVRRTKNVMAVQEKFLLSLLRSHRDTEFGRQYGLAELKTIEQFRDRIPVLTYSHYEPYVERIAQGEPNILTPEPVIYLNLTSGSTGKQKLIPVTQRSRQVRSQVNQTSTGFLAEAMQRRKLPLGKLLVTTSARVVGQTSSGIDYGFVSAGDLRLNSKLYRQVAVQPFEALQVADSLARHYVCLLFALCDPQMRIVGANFPVLGLQLSHYLESCAEDLIHDIETGEIAPWLKLEPGIRASLERSWSSNPHRAAELRHILKTEGRLTPQLVWNLSAVVTALGGTSNFYLERFPTYFGDTPIFGGIYASSEAAFGTYYELNNEGTILAVNAGFFEFIAEDQWHVTEPKTLLPCEVTPGNYYRIVVTNYSGLYRYDINDVVEVLGFYNEAPIIVFRHRVGGLLSSTTEKTTEFHVAQVMQRLQQRFNLTVENFCVTLSEHEIPPHYLVNIELATGEQLTHAQDFIQHFDRYLQEIQPSYAVKRPEPIPPPRLRILASGSFATLRQQMLQRGIPESQLKFPHISDDRHLLTGLPIEREIDME